MDSGRAAIQLRFQPASKAPDDAGRERGKCGHFHQREHRAGCPRESGFCGGHKHRKRGQVSFLVPAIRFLWLFGF